MFTGIITDQGEVINLIQSEGGRRFRIKTAYDLSTLDLGASIAHAGCCLTVISKDLVQNSYEVDVSLESLSVTNLEGWQVGTKINLERALKLGDELGGHIVSGHVDGVGEVLSVTQDGDSYRLSLSAPKPLHRYIAPKGSITVDGVSLTVNEVEDQVFGVNLIPHTYAVTTLNQLRPGSRINLEIDLMARYAARWRETAPTADVLA